MYAYRFNLPDTTSFEKVNACTLLAMSEKAPLQLRLPYIERNGALTLLGTNNIDARTSTVAGMAVKQTPIKIAITLGKVGIMCGVGYFYLKRLLEAMRITPSIGVLPFSLVHYTSTSDIEKLMAELDNIL